MKRETYQKPQSSRLYWLGVASNLICCLTFSGLLIWFAIYALDHLG